MSTILALAVVSVLTVAYVLTEHPILFVALAVAGRRSSVRRCRSPRPR